MTSSRRVVSPLVKLVVFVVVTTLASYVLVTTITNPSYTSSTPYYLEFSDATGLVQGDEVRIAGVRIGQVTSIGLTSAREHPLARIGISVDSTLPLPSSLQATIRYRNLVGERYVALTEGVGSPTSLPRGATLPVSATHPALDLTVLFGGFRPLFTALTPSDVNRLSFEIIQVFQGEGGTLEALLSHVASLTSTLADKDALIGSVIQNLTSVMSSLAARDQELSHLVTSLQQFVSGLSSDRTAIFDSLQQIDSLTTSTSSLLASARPPLAADITALGHLSTNLADSQSVLEGFLKLEPQKLDLITRTAINGSWFNFYLCGASGNITLPGSSSPSPVPAGGLSNQEKGCT